MPTPDTGVYRRDQSAHWQWRIKVPTDLRSCFDKPWASRVSLKTSDLRAANLKAAQLRASWLLHFEALRHARQAGQTPPTTLPRTHACPEPPEPHPAASGALLDHLSTARPLAAVEPATRITHQGSATLQKYLRDVFDRWKVSGEKRRSLDSIQATDRALRQFESQYRATRLGDITRDMGDRYRAWLRDECRTPKTASDRLTAIKSLLKFASETLQWIPQHPWRGLNITATTTSKRRPWLAQELQALFSHPLHTAYALPTADSRGRLTDDGGPAAYWIPLLGLYTGARLGELCQLQAKDVVDFDGVPALVITDEGDGQQVKTDAGRRTIPLHSELIRLGFLKYVDAICATGSKPLWPLLKIRRGKPSDHFGRWFRSHRAALGLAGDGGPTFHYFRHTVRPLMRNAGFSSAVMDKITGHESKGSIGDVVYDHWQVRELLPAIEAITFPFLVLQPVSPHSTW